jgi:hypothetical protein
MEDFINDITDFLPKYSNINNYKSDDMDFLNPYENFYESIFEKKEFFDEKLEKTEAYIDALTPLKHQKIIARFLSSHTPYDALLLLHAMGTGKTFAAINAIEQIKKENSTFDGAIICTKGKGLHQNFKTEIVEHTGTVYVPESFNTENERIARTNKLIGKYYTFYTFYDLAKLVTNTKNEELLKQMFSNKIIVIDEAHNIRLKEEKKKKTSGKVIREVIYTYKQFYKLLHLVENCKILLMSGTPIKDTIDEFANILNLIIPEKLKLPTKKQFIKKFFNFDSNIPKVDRTYYFKKNKKDELKKLLKGRVSYLKSISDVKKEFIGTKNVGDLKHFIVHEDLMSQFQSKIAIEVFDKDRKIEDKKKAGLYLPSRQCSLFIFPDKSYGKNGFSTYVKTTKLRKINKKKELVSSGDNYSLSNELREVLDGDTIEAKLKNLERYSSKYAYVIRKLLDAHKNKKSSFIYCEYVKGSGAILLSLILNLFGFSKANGDETEKGLRYAIINNITTSANKIKTLKERFNKPDNMFGEYISVIIGSKVVSEGFSFKNIQEEHILTPHWNYSETDQAIARGYRFGSHNALINAGITPILKVYQYVSIPVQKIDDKKQKIYSKSIDLLMYERSEVKDINIKKIERIIKESAFDCALTYERNFTEGYDYQRECDYTSCYYNCDGINPELYKDEFQDIESEEEIDFEEDDKTEDDTTDEDDDDKTEAYKSTDEEDEEDLSDEEDKDKDERSSKEDVDKEYNDENLQSDSELDSEIENELDNDAIDRKEIKRNDIVMIIDDEYKDVLTYGKFLQMNKDGERYEVRHDDGNLFAYLPIYIVKITEEEYKKNDNRELFNVYYQKLQDYKYQKLMDEMPELEPDTDNEDSGDGDMVLDYSTYQLYYNKNTINILIKDISNLFKNYFKLELSTIINNFLNYQVYEVITSLNIIINENRIIYNKFGFPNYLRQDNNEYFLVDILSVQSNVYSDYYTQNPLIVADKPFSKILNDMYLQNIPIIIKNIFKLETEEDVKKEIFKLPIEIIETILENSIIANVKNIIKNKKQRDIILEIFKNDYIYITEDDTWISWFLYQSKKILRCLKNIEDGWINCGDEYYEKFSDIQQQKQKQRRIENEYGYIGLYNESTGKFCLYQLEDPEEFERIKKGLKEKSIKGSALQKGLVCGTGDKMKKIKMLEFALSIFKLPFIDTKDSPYLKYFNDSTLKKHYTAITNIKDKKVSELLKVLKKDDDLIQLAEENKIKDVDDLTNDEIKYYYYYRYLSASAICQIIRKFLEEKQLIIPSKTCGGSKGSRLTQFI